MKKRYTMTIYLLCCFAFVLICYTNISVINTTIKTIITINIPLLDKAIPVNLFFIICFMSVIGFLIGRYLPSKKKDLQSYKRQYEKISISNEEQNDKVKVLEEKVKSLEIALERALNK